MADELDEEEREILAKHREKKKAAQDADRKEQRVWMRKGATGDEIDLPYNIARPAVQKDWGLDLDDEPVQDVPEPSGPRAVKDDDPGEGKRYHGRRVS